MLMHIDLRVVDGVREGVRVVRGGTPKDAVQAVDHICLVSVRTGDDDGHDALERP